MHPPARLAWGIWAVGASLYLAGFFQRVAPAVMTQELMAEFALPAAGLGNLSAFYLYGYVAMQIPTGLMADRFGARRVLAAGAAVGVLRCRHDDARHRSCPEHGGSRRRVVPPTGTEYECVHDSRQERIYHAAVDAGADLVIGHHPHVVQDVERYGGGTIFYSLGNFIFGGNSRDTYETALFQAVFAGDSVS